jgi:tRNA (mo5U34)-methyltransferase
VSLVTEVSRSTEELSWYHTFRLPDGSLTDGYIDTVDEVRHVPLPESLAGKRCLDVGTCDGFWAIEMAKRGGQVTAIDIPDARAWDWPARATSATRAEAQTHLDGRRRAFDFACETFGVEVDRRDTSVYDASREGLGSFDFIFIGSLLLHLRDPVAALAALRRVGDGELLSVDAVSPMLTAMHPRQPVARLEAPDWPLWWGVNLAAYRHMFVAAGWSAHRTGGLFFQRMGSSFTPRGRQSRVVGRSPAWVLRQELQKRLGILHSWVLATPA